MEALNEKILKERYPVSAMFSSSLGGGYVGVHIYKSHGAFRIYVVYYTITSVSILSHPTF